MKENFLMYLITFQHSKKKFVKLVLELLGLCMRICSILNTILTPQFDLDFLVDDFSLFSVCPLATSNNKTNRSLSYKIGYSNLFS